MASAPLREIPVMTIDGRASSLADFAGKTVMVVNVASKCGLTPQYEQLEQLQKTYEARGFTVIGFPCNQFAGQEPGTAEEIVEFCSATYGVTFPLMEKIEVNGPGAHPLYDELTRTPDGQQVAGPVQWNFEKFVITPDDVVTRFRPQTLPDDPEIVALIERALERASAG